MPDGSRPQISVFFHHAPVQGAGSFADFRDVEVDRPYSAAGRIVQALKRTRILLATAVLAQIVGSLEAQIHPIHATVSFPQGTSLTTPATIQPYVISIVIGDFDLDGLPDVAAASQFPSKIAWYRNNGDGTFGQQL